MRLSVTARGWGWCVNCIKGDHGHHRLGPFDLLANELKCLGHPMEVAHSVPQALALVEGETAAVIGGAEIYAQFLPLADWIEMTEVHGRYDGDTVMPPLGPEWHEIAREAHEAADGKPAYTFVTLKRSL